MRNFFTTLPIILAATVLFIIPAGESHALKGFDLGVRGYYWDTGLDGKIQTNNDPEIDLKNDLNISDEAFGSGEVFLRWGRNHFTLAYTTVSNSGSAPNGVVFNGVPFPGPIDSDYEYDQIDFIYQYDLIRYNPVIATFNLGVVLQVKYVDGFAEVRGDVPIIGFRVEREDFSAPVPMIGLGAGVGIVNGTVVLEGRVAGLEYDGNRAIDGQALLGVSPFPFLKIFGGYKVFDIKVDEDDFRADYTLDGPFAGVQLSF